MREIFQLCEKDFQLCIVFIHFLSSFIFSRCGPSIPVLLNPPPLAVYHKDKAIVSGSIGFPFAGAEADFFLDKNKKYDLGAIAGVWGSSYNLSLFGRRWFFTKGGNPWGNIYISLQGSDNLADVESSYEVEKLVKYFSSHVELGFSPGFFREVFNISLNLRGGAGIVFPYKYDPSLALKNTLGYYLFGASALNLSLFPFKHFGFGLEGSLGLGLGELKDIAVFALPPFIRAFLSVRF